MQARPEVPKDLKTYVQICEEFKISRPTLFRLIAERNVTRYKRPGDKKFYLSREEVTEAMGAQPVTKARPIGSEAGIS